MLQSHLSDKLHPETSLSQARVLSNTRRGTHYDDAAQGYSGGAEVECIQPAHFLFDYALCFHADLAQPLCHRVWFPVLMKSAGVSLINICIFDIHYSWGFKAYLLSGRMLD
jgi:hypothetical protein